MSGTTGGPVTGNNAGWLLAFRRDSRPGSLFFLSTLDGRLNELRATAPEDTVVFGGFSVPPADPR